MVNTDDIDRRGNDLKTVGRDDWARPAKSDVLREATGAECMSRLHC